MGRGMSGEEEEERSVESRAELNRRRSGTGSGRAVKSVRVRGGGRPRRRRSGRGPRLFRSKPRAAGGRGPVEPLPG